MAESSFALSFKVGWSNACMQTAHQTLGIFMQFLLFYKHSKFAKLSTHKQKIPYIGKLSNSAKFYFAQTFLVRKLKIFLHSKFRKAHACQLQCLCIVGSNLWMSFQSSKRRKRRGEIWTGVSPASASHTHWEGHQCPSCKATSTRASTRAVVCIVATAVVPRLPSLTETGSTHTHTHTHLCRENQPAASKPSTRTP